MKVFLQVCMQVSLDMWLYFWLYGNVVNFRKLIGERERTPCPQPVSCILSLFAFYFIYLSHNLSRLHIILFSRLISQAAGSRAVCLVVFELHFLQKQNKFYKLRDCLYSLLWEIPISYLRLWCLQGQVGRGIQETCLSVILIFSSKTKHRIPTSTRMSDFPLLVLSVPTPQAEREFGNILGTLIA